MQKPDIERRAAELHEGCRMPMEQARELAASEASQDWYARGQDWGLADALTAGQNEDWTLDDIARAFAAGAQAGGALESKRAHEVECRCVALEEQADLTAIHLARMQSALEQNGSRSADYLRKAIKAEATVEAMQARQAEFVAVLARLCELNAAERPMAKVWNAAQALVDSHKGADTRKPCTCDGAGRGPGRACVVKAGGRLGDLWRCADGCAVDKTTK